MIATYHVTCGSCDLDQIFEARDWRCSRVRIDCCVCRAKGSVPMPEDATRAVCGTCGVETLIQRIVAEC